MTVSVVREAKGFRLLRDDVDINAWTPALRSVAGSHITIGVRPDCVVRDDAGQIRATVGAASFRAGREVRLLSIGGLEIASSELDLAQGESILVRFARYHVFDGKGRLLMTVE